MGGSMRWPALLRPTRASVDNSTVPSSGRNGLVMVVLGVAGPGVVDNGIDAAEAYVEDSGGVLEAGGV